MPTRFFFYDFEYLDIQSVVEGDSIVDGVNCMSQFKPLTHTQHTSEPEFVIVSKVEHSSMERIEARGTRSYTGKNFFDWFMLEVVAKNGKFQIKPSENNSLFLKKIRMIAQVVELGEATYLLGNLIIEDMNVVREVLELPRGIEMVDP